jgi:hypothetical protein
MIKLQHMTLIDTHNANYNVLLMMNKPHAVSRMLLNWFTAPCQARLYLKKCTLKAHTGWNCNTNNHQLTGNMNLTSGFDVPNVSDMFVGG